MSVLDDIAFAMDSYPTTNTAIEFLNVEAVDPADGTDISVNEKWKFKIKVTNDGHVNMTDVYLHVNGANGTMVGTSPSGPFKQDVTLTVGPLKVNGGGGTATTSLLYLQASATTQAEDKQLLGAHISAWNGNFDHYFTSHTKDEGPKDPALYPSVKYPREIIPA
jgi:hypothetical protein